MKFPPPGPPPAWYWKLPLVWRQLYCRWYLHRHWHLYDFFTKRLTRRYLFTELPRVWRFRWFCFKADQRDYVRENRGKRLCVRLRALFWAIGHNHIYWV